MIEDVTPAPSVTCVTPVPVIEHVTPARLAHQILNDFNDEGFELVPQEHVKRCVGNFAPPEAPILMNSFENANSQTPTCVQRQADGHSFVSLGKRASVPDMVIANTTSTSSTSTSTNAPVPEIQEQGAEGAEQALENIVSYQVYSLPL